LKNRVGKAFIAARFHNTVAQLALNIAQNIRQDFGINHFVLSGGVWQNQLLLERTLLLFKNEGLQALIHQQLPPNDGCVAFGQALITAYKYLQDKE
jgi:hydrogenase maturation protein HypF